MPNNLGGIFDQPPGRSVSDAHCRGIRREVVQIDDRSTPGCILVGQVIGPVAPSGLFSPHRQVKVGFRPWYRRSGWAVHRDRLCGQGGQRMGSADWIAAEIHRAALPCIWRSA